MERDINVVAQVKEDGSIAFKTGDGLPLQMDGGGGGHLYRHKLNVSAGDGKNYYIYAITNNNEVITSQENIPDDNYPVFYCDSSNGEYVLGLKKNGSNIVLFAMNPVSDEWDDIEVQTLLIISDTVTQIL